MRASSRRLLRATPTPSRPTPARTNTWCCGAALQGTALDMVEDVNTGVAWALRKAERYGGDPERVWLVGQSAGGQLALLALLTQAAQAASGSALLGGAPVWHASALAGVVGVSGAYDLEVGRRGWLAGWAGGWGLMGLLVAVLGAAGVAACVGDGSATACSPGALNTPCWALLALPLPNDTGPGAAPACARAVQGAAGHHHDD